jgi:uncharacterized membrane protein
VSRSPLVNILVALLLVLVAATVIGLVLLWPGSRTIERPESLASPKTEAARITGVREAPCGPATEATCARVTAELKSGPEEGRRVTFTVAATEVTLGVGDRIRVYKNPATDAPLGVRVDPYSFSDFERRAPMAWLAAIFVGLVLLTGRWQGLRALIGLGASLLVLILFVIPAILHGEEPTTVAFVGAMAVMLATIPVTHGLGAKTVAACLGTATSLLLTLVLADVFIDFTHLSGVSSEEAVFLRATQEDLSLTGLLLAGMVIGALGVLDDLTVSQASTVLALRRANRALGFGGLFRGALAVGHDHIAATVNTLVLAYAGASLPVLLVFGLADTPLIDAVNFETVAEAVVATLVGSIGLILAVPVTTSLAALLALHLEESRLADAHAGHVH